MLSTISFFALLGAVSALPPNYPPSYPYGTGVSSSSLPPSSSSLPPYPYSSSTPIPSSSSSESIIHPITYTSPTNILTGVTRSTDSTKTTESILTGVEYHTTVATTTVPCTKTTTITTFVPCSSTVSHHGNTYYTTWLSTKYITSTYTTVKPSTYTIYPTPNGHHGNCPAPAYITVTVTETKTETLPSPSKHTKTESILTGVEYHPTTTDSILTGVTRSTDTTSILTGVTKSTDTTSLLTGATRSTDSHHHSKPTGYTSSSSSSSVSLEQQRCAAIELLAGAEHFAIYSLLVRWTDHMDSRNGLVIVHLTICISVYCIDTCISDGVGGSHIPVHTKDFSFD